MKILVTGAAGFIGSHLCGALVDRGDEVVGLDNFDPFYSRSVKETNTAQLLQDDNFKLIEGDIRAETDLDQAFGEKIDLVVHLAALAGVRPSIEQPARYQSVNIGGTTEVLEAMRRHRVSKMVFASSSSVYGNNRKVPFHEDDPVDRPISPYAATKRACELILHTYHHLFNLDVFCLRFFTVYGPRQRPDLAIHKFTRMISAGETIPMYGDGSSRRDYTYIDDILQGVLAAIDRVRGFQIYNLGESQTTCLSDLISLIGSALKAEPCIDQQPMQAGDVDQTFADISRARSELDYSPTTKVAEGIPKFAEWFRKQA